MFSTLISRLINLHGGSIRSIYGENKTVVVKLQGSHQTIELIPI